MGLIVRSRAGIDCSRDTVEDYGLLYGNVHFAIIDAVDAGPASNKLTGPRADRPCTSAYLDLELEGEAVSAPSAAILVP